MNKQRYSEEGYNDNVLLELETDIKNFEPGAWKNSISLV